VIGPSQIFLPDNKQHSQQTATMHQTGFEPEIPANERPQTHALDGAATGIGILGFYEKEISRGVSICVTDAVLIGYQDHK
jgi:hypothetical protein